MTTCALLISVILMSRCVCVVALVCAGVCVKGLLPVKVYVRAREVRSGFRARDPFSEGITRLRAVGGQPIMLVMPLTSLLPDPGPHAVLVARPVVSAAIQLQWGSVHQRSAARAALPYTMLSTA